MVETNEVKYNVEIGKGRNMRRLTILIAMRIDDNLNDAIGVNNSHEAINDKMNQ